MRILKRILRILAWILAILLILLIIFCIYVWQVSDPKPPKIQDPISTNLNIQHPEGSLYTIGDNWIRKNEFGLFEMYVSGKPYERGLKNGMLSAPLLAAQEKAFTDQIREMVPSPGYLKFLRYIVGFMNRDLPAHVDKEYQEEIYGISRSAEDSFQWIGSNYGRILNYHAAHDIGHALQNMMLVGCTSFGAWGSKTDQGELLLGRNFDFWVGDAFAENKIVAFYRPEKGHPFMFVTWGGFTGVVSGMNTAGLTVTINAARSKIPWGAATPVSILAREILQYAGNIDEAVAIAKQKKMFVSESFLIGSAADHKAVVIEKTPDRLAVFDPAGEEILCTNHYQSSDWSKDELNNKQMEESASVYRYQRLQELLQSAGSLNPGKVAGILRDRGGKGGKAIGNGNERALNQLLAHHSIIFQPDSLRVWVSTSPWQLGSFVCYDLKKVFSMHGLQRDTTIAENRFNIAADSFLNRVGYRQFIQFKKEKLALSRHQEVDTASVIQNNPLYYDAYRIAGDYSKSMGWKNAALHYYKMALALEPATQGEYKAIEEKMNGLNRMTQ